MQLNDPSTWVKPAHIDCEMCEAVLVGVEDYVDHKRRRHPPMPCGMEYLYCTPCQIVFCGMRSMRSHMTETHLPQCQKGLTLCQECGRDFDHGAALARHRKMDHDVCYTPRVVLKNCGIKRSDTPGDKSGTARHTSESDTSSDSSVLIVSEPDTSSDSSVVIEDTVINILDDAGTEGNVGQLHDESLTAGAQAEMPDSASGNEDLQTNHEYPPGPGYVYLGGRWWWKD